MTTNASRAPIDLDAFERDMQHLHLQGRAEPGAKGEPQGMSDSQGKGDPLAELARIVGQDDPFRALLAARDGRRPARTEPSFAAEPDQETRQGDLDVRPGAADPAAQGVPADAFDQYLASIDRDFGGPGFQEEGQLEPAPEGDVRSLKRARPRRGLYAVGAGLAVVAVSVAGSLAWRGLHRDHSGGVPLIQADTAPLKIAPKTADGVEIPDQNKQIYEPRAKDGQIRIVNREEQPIDVGQAVRSGQGDGASGSATPQGGLSDAFGEPRRVRTVSVKPDTPVPPPQAREPEAAAPPPIPTLVMPTEAEAAPAPPAPAPTLAKVRPVRQAAPTVASVIPAAVAAPVAEAAPVAPPAPVRTKAPQRVASVAPDNIIPLEAPATTAATSPSAGGYAVQLGVSGSERDAQAALRGFQAKFSQLSGKPELIRQAEVNGKSIYRVRVGPFAKAEATSLCEGLKGEGGACFVAKN